MIELAVVLLTAIPVATFALLGFRIGDRRVLRAAVTWIVPWSSGMLLTQAGFRAGWYYPFGLVTPVVMGLLGIGVCFETIRRLTRKFPRKPTASPISLARGINGSLLGMACGLCFASTLWIAALLADGFISGPQPPSARALHSETSQRWLNSLVRTANRGFLRHLPLIGSLSDEVEALVFILNVDEKDRAKFGTEKEWGRLEKLPSFRAILADQKIFDEIDAVSQGNLAALYRLQSHPLVIAFFQEKEVRELMVDLRPSILAEQLEASIANSRGE